MSDERVKELVAQLKDENWEVRFTAAHALGKIGKKHPGCNMDSAVSALVEMLKDDDYKVRGEAAECLEKVGDVSAVPALIDALRDKDSDVRLRAVWALEGIGDVSAIPEIIKSLKDGNPGVRLTAAWVLEKIVGKNPEYDPCQIVSALIDALGDKLPEVGSRVAESLIHIGPKGHSDLRRLRSAAQKAKKESKPEGAYVVAYAGYSKTLSERAEEYGDRKKIPLALRNPRTIKPDEITRIRRVNL